MKRKIGSDAVVAALCRRLKASDGDAFEEVFRLFRDDLVRYVRSIVGDDPIAHDLVQDVFLSLWGLRTTLEPSGSLKNYLYRMARNRALRHHRDERLHARKRDEWRNENGANKDVPQARMDAGALDHRIKSWIEELPDRQREAFVLSRFHELSHKEIAALMEISPRTVNNHIMRALENLQGRIQAYDPKFSKR